MSSKDKFDARKIATIDKIKAKKLRRRKVKKATKKLR